VNNGMDALEILISAYDNNEKFDIVIIDNIMPEMNGENLGIEIKNNEKLKNTKLVFMSSISNRGDAGRLKNIGFNAFLPKPIPQKDLYDCLAQVMGIKTDKKSEDSDSLITRHSINEDRKKSVKLLLVEDNHTNRIVARAIFGKLGYTIDEAVNGLEAIEILEKKAYDIVFMDIQMPIMSGLEATQKIRDKNSIVLNHNIPIIAMTANAMKGDREKCIETGMDDYLTKPIEVKKVIEVLEKWIPVKYEFDAVEKIDNVDKNDDIDGILFNKEIFMNRVLNDMEIAQEIGTGFLDDIQNEITKLKESLHQENIELIERQIHTIKGASANISADIFCNLAKEMEKLVKDGELARFADQITELEDVFENTKNVIKEELGI